MCGISLHLEIIFYSIVNNCFVKENYPQTLFGHKRENVIIIQIKRNQNESLTIELRLCKLNLHKYEKCGIIL